MAALAPAAAQRGGADPGVLQPHPLVQVQQVLRLLAATAARRSAALPACSPISARAASRRAVSTSRVARDLRPLGRGRLAAALGGLLALHDVEHDLLEVGLPAGERDDLRLQVLQFAGGRDLPGVEPLAVPVDAGANLIDICLRLGQRALEVALLSLERGDGVAQLRVTLLELIELRVLGEPRRRFSSLVSSASRSASSSSRSCASGDAFTGPHVSR